tara:strand:+ start:360 stop:806 length:447 start_codon:yes stop_codon:yes gene_type:complete
MKIIFYILFIFFFFVNLLFANENNYYLTLKYNEVNVRYGPGRDYPVKYIYNKKNLPVKVIDKFWEWKKVIDFKKNSGWIHETQLKKGKSFILLKDQILFAKPTKHSKPLFKIAKGRLLIVKKCKKNWCRVKTENFLGWVKTNEIWGLY